jgi:large subunit ribosomal protein L29
MALPKITEVRGLTDQEVSDEILSVKRQLFELRFKMATRQEGIKPHEFKHLRHRLAQLMTVERERQLMLNLSRTDEDNPETLIEQEV